MNATRRKTPMKKSTVVKIAVAIALVLIAGTVAVLMLRSHVSEQFGGDDKAEVTSAQVTKGNISTTVSGSGTLTNEESEDTFISGTVDVTEIYVNAGDEVKKGDMLASVNSASVVKAMKEVQDEIDKIDTKIGELSEEDISETISAGVDGRIKKIYVSAGDSVADVMYDNGALMLLSADGYLQLDVKTSALSNGDSVTVKVDGGDTYEGTVDAVWADTATVLIADDAAPYGAKATVAKDGTDIGSGTLSIHEQVTITGFTGSVTSVNVAENEYVYSGTSLITIEGASSTVNYATLLEQRADLEKQLQDLVVIHKEGAVYAQKNGMVTAISETEDSTTTTTTAVTATAAPSSSSSKKQGSETSTVTVAENTDNEDGTTISICPTDIMTVQFTVDETDILALKVGQQAEVTVSALGEDAYSAKVTKLDTVGTSSDGSTAYTATLELDKQKGMLDGMSASVVITIEGKDDALLVPVDAVQKTSSTAYVYTSYDEETGELGDMIEVVCGLSNSKYIEVSSGLSEGDTVYYTTSKDEMSNFFGMGGPSGMGSMGSPPSGMGNFGGNMGDRPSGGSGFPGRSGSSRGSGNRS